MWACLAQIYSDEYAFGFGDGRDHSRSCPGCGPPGGGARSVEPSLRSRAGAGALLPPGPCRVWPRGRARYGLESAQHRRARDVGTDDRAHRRVPRGAAIVRRAMELNPNHAGWMHFAPLWEHFHKGEYEQALERANRVDVPGPSGPISSWRRPAVTWAGAPRASPRSGICWRSTRNLRRTLARTSGSGTSRAASWIRSSKVCAKRGSRFLRPADNPTRRADGTVETTRDWDRSRRRGLLGRGAAVQVQRPQRFPHSAGGWALRGNRHGVVALLVSPGDRARLHEAIRGSGDRRAVVGKELGARYVMEGSLRQAGASATRVQLVDAVPGAHCGPRTTIVPSGPRSHSRCRTTSCPGSFRRSPICTASCRIA